MYVGRAFSIFFLIICVILIIIGSQKIDAPKKSEERKNGIILIIVGSILLPLFLYLSTSYRHFLLHMWGSKPVKDWLKVGSTHATFSKVGFGRSAKRKSAKCKRRRRRR